MNTTARFVILNTIALNYDGTLKNGDEITDAGEIVTYVNGMLESVGGQPSYDDQNGHMEFHKANRLHRNDGPAVIDGYAATVEHWVEGVRQDTLSVGTSGPRLVQHVS